MGSRLMHLAIAASVRNELPGVDRNRFLLGSLLPDAAFDGNSRSHWKIYLSDGQKRTYDLRGFRALFSEQLKSDPLYLGYYLHLVQDLMFRRFVYYTHRWDPYPAGNVERLHRDYALLNPYIVEKYRLESPTEAPRLTEPEPLTRGCEYDVPALLRELQTDFVERPEGEFFFFRPDMADDYISLSVPACVSELSALQTGGGFVDEIALAWS